MCAVPAPEGRGGMGKRKTLSEAVGEADLLLERIGRAGQELEEEEARARAEMEEVRRKYHDQIAGAKARMEIWAEELRRLMRTHKRELFSGEDDRLELAHGALLYAVEEYVVKARRVLRRLKEAGLLEAVKVAESVDWDKLRTWPEEKLVMVGTERKRREVFAYEIRRQA